MERKRLPLSPVRQRTGGNDVLPLVNNAMQCNTIQYSTIQYNTTLLIPSNRLSIKLIDQNDIRFPFIKDKNMAEAGENSFECPFDFKFPLLWKRLNFFFQFSKSRRIF